MSNVKFQINTNFWKLEIGNCLAKRDPAPQEKLEIPRFSGEGFTLVEVLVAFTVLAMLSALSAVSFVSYNRSQVIGNTAKDIEQLLAVAKSRTQSQVKPPACEERAFVGYEFRVCGGTTECLTPGGDYELVGVCSGEDGEQYFVHSVPADNMPPKKLPQGITFDESSLGSSYQFKVLTGGVSGSGDIALKGPDGLTRVITVDKQGNIDEENED